jgi:hypothetical protein
MKVLAIINYLCIFYSYCEVVKLGSFKLHGCIIKKGQDLHSAETAPSFTFDEMVYINTH